MLPPTSRMTTGESLLLSQASTPLLSEGRVIPSLPWGLGGQFPCKSNTTQEGGGPLPSRVLPATCPFSGSKLGSLS